MSDTWKHRNTNRLKALMKERGIVHKFIKYCLNTCQIYSIPFSSLNSTYFALTCLEATQLTTASKKYKNITYRQYQIRMWSRRTRLLATPAAVEIFYGQGTSLLEGRGGGEGRALTGKSVLGLNLTNGIPAD